MINAIASALSGLEKAASKVDKAAENIATHSSPETIDTIDLSEEAINLKLGGFEYKANAAVLRVVNEQNEELMRLFDKEV